MNGKIKFHKMYIQAVPVAGYNADVVEDDCICVYYSNRLLNFVSEL